MESHEGNRKGHDIEALAGIARTAARLWPRLAPMGGDRWTPEDIEHCVSVAFEISRGGAFLAAFPQGLHGDGPRAYLLTSVRNSLLREKKRHAWLEILTEISLDGLPPPPVPRLCALDAQSVAGRIVGMLGEDAAAELLRRLEGQRGGRRNKGALCGPDPSWRTGERLWAKVKEAVIRVSCEEDLGREEVGDVLAALHALLAPRGHS